MCSPASASFRETRSIRADSVGITVVATASDKPTAQQMATGMSVKSCPASSSTKTTGRKTAIVVRVLARTAPQTSRVPSRAVPVMPDSLR